MLFVLFFIFLFFFIISCIFSPPPSCHLDLYPSLLPLKSNEWFLSTSLITPSSFPFKGPVPLLRAVLVSCNLLATFFTFYLHIPPNTMRTVSTFYSDFFFLLLLACTDMCSFLPFIFLSSFLCRNPQTFKNIKIKK